MADAFPNRPADTALRRPGVATVIVFACLCAAIIGADLWLKHWTFAHLADRPVDAAAVAKGAETLPMAQRMLIPKVLGLKLMLNRGAVFGIGQGHTWVFLVVGVVAVGVVGFLFSRTHRRDWLSHIVLTLILAGAIGNFVDRAQFAAVRDMLWLFPEIPLPFGWHWPRFVGGSNEVYPWVFNLADVYLVIGIGMLVVRTLFFSGTEAEKANSPAAAAAK